MRMISTTVLLLQVGEYKEQCRKEHRKPTYKGLASALNISTATVANVTHGRFNGTAYTDKPAATRCVDNPDFEVIQGLFGVSCDRTD